MTDHGLDPARIRSALELLQKVDPSSRLLSLQNLCTNNGVWTIPRDASRHRPVLFEVQLFGVPAMTDDAADLPRVWMIAARATLQGLQA